MAVPKTGDGRSHWTGRKWSRRKLAALWISEGGNPDIAYLMADIALSESRGYEGAISPTGCRGLWQICPPPDDATNPQANARYAIAKANDGLHHWTNYNTTAANLVAAHYRNPDRNKRAGQRLKQAGLFGPFSPGPGPDLFDLPGGGGDDGGDSLLDRGGDLLQDINPLAGITDPILKIGEVIVNWSNKLADPNTWKDAGKIMLGLILLYMGLKRTFELQTG